LFLPIIIDLKIVGYLKSLRTFSFSNKGNPFQGLKYLTSDDLGGVLKLNLYQIDPIINKLFG